jgi:hypothetical protein
VFPELREVRFKIPKQRTYAKSHFQKSICKRKTDKRIRQKRIDFKVVFGNNRKNFSQWVSIKTEAFNKTLISVGAYIGCAIFIAAVGQKILGFLLSYSLFD